MRAAKKFGLESKVTSPLYSLSPSCSFRSKTTLQLEKKSMETIGNLALKINKI